MSVSDERRRRGFLGLVSVGLLGVPTGCLGPGENEDDDGSTDDDPNENEDEDENGALGPPEA